MTRYEETLYFEPDPELFEDRARDDANYATSTLSASLIVGMVGKSGRLRTVPVPAWCKGLIEVWIHDTGVTEGKVFRRVSKNGIRQDEGVTTDIVWYAVK